MLPTDVGVYMLPCVSSPSQYLINNVLKIFENLEKWRFLRVFSKLCPLCGQYCPDGPSDGFLNMPMTRPNKLGLNPYNFLVLDQTFGDILPSDKQKHKQTDILILLLYR